MEKLKSFGACFFQACKSEKFVPQLPALIVGLVLSNIISYFLAVNYLDYKSESNLDSAIRATQAQFYKNPSAYFNNVPNLSGKWTYSTKNRAIKGNPTNTGHVKMIDCQNGDITFKEGYRTTENGEELKENARP